MVQLPKFRKGNPIIKVIGGVLTLMFGFTGGELIETEVTAKLAVAANWTWVGHSIVESVIELIPLMYYTGTVVGSAMAFMYL